MEEVKQHRTVDDAWTVLRGKVLIDLAARTVSTCCHACSFDVHPELC